MRRRIYLAALVICVLGASAANATKCNYDLTNTCYRDAYDVALVFQGNVSFSEFYDDMGDGHPTVTTQGGTTTVHWVKRQPVGTAPQPIGLNQTVHFGVTPVSDPPGCDDYREIYWTDEHGRRIGSCYVGTATNHLTGTSYTITNRSHLPIQVTDVRMACQKEDMPLPTLSAKNVYLANAMIPIAGSATLDPGKSWVIPVTPSCSDCYCVTNYKTMGEGLGAIFSPWVQEFVP